MKKGFTLMEVLAVVLILAVIGSFAVPAVRSVRSELKHRQAMSAFQLLVEAVQQAKDRSGMLLEEKSVFIPTENKDILYASACNEIGATGIPASRRAEALGRLSFSDLFACGYLNPKDFKGLEYAFVTEGCNKNGCFLRLEDREGKYPNEFRDLWVVMPETVADIWR